jgi:hypothetical protein
MGWMLNRIQNVQARPAMAVRTGVRIIHRMIRRQQMLNSSNIGDNIKLNFTINNNANSRNDNERKSSGSMG